MSNAALYYHPDGYRTDGKKLMGRQAAGEGFLKGFLAHADVETVYAYCASPAMFQNFERTCADIDQRTPPLPRAFVHRQDQAALNRIGGLFLPGPNLEEFAWRRRRHGATHYSITGITHTTASDGVMASLCGLLTGPFTEWDALICTSTHVHRTIAKLHDGYGSYLAGRLGATRLRTPVQMPVIPLGVFAEDFDPPAPQKQQHRARLRQQYGIAEEDFVVLFVGRLSFHAKANPLPMLIALEQVSKVIGPKRKVHLIQSGWFANQAIEDAFLRANSDFAPSVTHHIVNGRDPDLRFNIWHAADCFCSLSDNIQETFGLTPIEAMAAGLPLVVTDWDGYRDTVVHGETGIRIPTILPPAEGGLPLAEQFEDEITTYDQYCAATSMATAVDIRSTVEAFASLAMDADLRQRLGQAGRERVYSYYDWRVVVGQYQTLWRHLQARRERASEAHDNSQMITGLDPHFGNNPLRPNPFVIFSDYATLQLAPHSRLYRGDVSGDALQKASRSTLVSMNGSRYVGASKLGQALFDRIKVTGKQGLSVEELIESTEEAERDRVPTLLGWLLKIGAITVDRNALDVSPATTGLSPAGTSKPQQGADR